MIVVIIDYLFEKSQEVINLEELKLMTQKKMTCHKSYAIDVNLL